eukprot:9173127-Pyramimonas_sp.AAC.1
MTGFATATAEIAEFEPKWRPVAEELMRSQHPMAKELVANKQLKPLGELCSGASARIKLARRFPGVIP